MPADRHAAQRMIQQALNGLRVHGASLQIRAYEKGTSKKGSTRYAVKCDSFDYKSCKWGAVATVQSNTRELNIWCARAEDHGHPKVPRRSGAGDPRRRGGRKVACEGQQLKPMFSWQCNGPTLTQPDFGPFLPHSADSVLGACVDFTRRVERSCASWGGVFLQQQVCYVADVLAFMFVN